MSDESYLSGFAHTYEGSDYGHIVRMLCQANCMNPIIFMDELDKIDTTRHGNSVVNKLIEIIDFSQNHEYQDMYFNNINIDLSRILFIFSLNHIEDVNPILKDRIEILTVKGFNKIEKEIIIKNYLIPAELLEVGLSDKDITFTNDIIQYIISKVSNLDIDEGVRELQRAIKIIIRKINLLQYMINIEESNCISYFIKDLKLPITVNKYIIDKFLSEYENKNMSKYLHMYT
tara:strand:- start:211 stop:903 length:693 start_codon:yes stop_codon:yes gene_type:complete